ncbi:MAG: hypothetical protein IKG21_03865 [Atopobiaceae bacterium]|nr:hypothetical protein [Atopobiaceae bacterium]
MQGDFHYYATYCAALLAGYTPAESTEICYSAQMADWCTRTFLSKLHAPLSAATTQSPIELAEARTDPIGLQDITRIWASFHFLPGDLYAEVPKGSRNYREKYRLICNPNGPLLADTVKLAKDRSLQAAGLAMHVLADTWAHRYFAGTPSLVINNVSRHFEELILLTESTSPASMTPDESSTSSASSANVAPAWVERELHEGEYRALPTRFTNNPKPADNPETSIYVRSVYQIDENSIMNLGHGRAGHFPDYSFARYRYLPAWGDYAMVLKDNPSDYYHAFAQMVYALRYLRGEYSSFEVNRYDWHIVAPWEEQIHTLLERRQLKASDDWRELGARISGVELEPFDVNRHVDEYLDATQSEHDKTVLGRYILAALAQKSMVTNRIYASGNILAGRSIDYDTHGFAGIRDYVSLLHHYGSAGRTLDAKRGTR